MIRISGIVEEAKNIQVISVSNESGEAIKRQVRECIEGKGVAWAVVQHLQNARDDESLQAPPVDVATEKNSDN